MCQTLDKNLLVCVGVSMCWGNWKKVSNAHGDFVHD